MTSATYLFDTLKQAFFSDRDHFIVPLKGIKDSIVTGDGQIASCLWGLQALHAMASPGVEAYSAILETRLEFVMEVAGMLVEQAHVEGVLIDQRWHDALTAVERLDSVLTHLAELGGNRPCVFLAADPAVAEAAGPPLIPGS